MSPRCFVADIFCRPWKQIHSYLFIKESNSSLLKLCRGKKKEKKEHYLPERCILAPKMLVCCVTASSHSPCFLFSNYPELLESEMGFGCCLGAGNAETPFLRPKHLFPSELQWARWTDLTLWEWILQPARSLSSLHLCWLGPCRSPQKLDSPARNKSPLTELRGWSLRLSWPRGSQQLRGGF